MYCKRMFRRNGNAKNTYLDSEISTLTYEEDSCFCNLRSLWNNKTSGPFHWQTNEPYFCDETFLFHCWAVLGSFLVNDPISLNLDSVKNYFTCKARSQRARRKATLVNSQQNHFPLFRSCDLKKRSAFPSCCPLQKAGSATICFRSQTQAFLKYTSLIKQQKSTSVTSVLCKQVYESFTRGRSWGPHPKTHMISRGRNTYRQIMGGASANAWRSSEDYHLISWSAL